MKNEICHVCKKEKKPYVVILDNSIMSMSDYITAREDGPICQRCYSYYAMTGEFKDATQEEYDIAKKAVEFANLMLLWWEKDKKLITDNNEDNKRNWNGTEVIKKWYRERGMKK
jgi:hypothetical protein